MRYTKHLANVIRPHSSNITSFYFAVKQSNNNKIQELESDHAADISRCDRELEHMAQQLANNKQKMEHERMQFQSKLDELELVSNQRYCETRNARHSVQDQINRARINEHKLQNYIDALKDSQSKNDNSIRDLKDALCKVRQENRASKRQLANAKKASSRPAGEMAPRKRAKTRGRECTRSNRENARRYKENIKGTHTRYQSVSR